MNETSRPLLLATLAVALAGAACGKESKDAPKSEQAKAAAPKPPAKPAMTEGTAAKMPMPDVEPGPMGDPAGLVVVTSKRSFDDTVKSLKQAIAAEKVAIVFEANHQNMMKMVGIESRPSVTIGFGKPEMGNMFMSKDPRLALEMPQRMTVRELDDGTVAVLYYRPSYLFAAYGKPPLVEMAKKMPDKLLAKLASAATDTDVEPGSGPAAPRAALVAVVSKNSFADTVAKLKAAIQSHGLATVFEANHQNMMKMVGIESAPSIAIGFAKPQMASEILAVDPRVALEMPLRVAVRQLDDGSVVVLYYAPSFLLSHYGNPKIRAMGENKLDKMVAMLVAMATS